MTLKRVFKALYWHLLQKHLVAWRSARRERAAVYREYPLVCDLGADASVAKGRALLDFVVDPFLPGFAAELARSHANYWQTGAIVDCLANAGYTVDVTDYRSMHAPPADNYDLVVGLGAAFEQSCRNSRADIPKVYLGWGLYAKATQAAVRKRCQALFERRGIRVEETHPSDDGPQYATDIIYLGNAYTRATYAQATDCPAIAVPNPITSGVQCTLDTKDFGSARSKFLWIAAYGVMRRSLDVLLEIFSTNPEYELWICGNINHYKSFVAAYRRELNDLPNIRYVGWVDVSGSEYQEATRNCGYVLYPSVSDGMPGSVVNAMASGLVPIVTEAAGMECGGHGMLIPEVNHSVILGLIRQAASVSPEELERQSKEAAVFASRFYSQDAFRTQFSAALSRVLERHRTGRLIHVAG